MIIYVQMGNASLASYICMGKGREQQLGMQQGYG